MKKPTAPKVKKKSAENIARETWGVIPEPIMRPLVFVPHPYYVPTITMSKIPPKIDIDSGSVEAINKGSE